MNQISLWRLAKYENGYAFKSGDITGSGHPIIRIRQMVDESAEVDLSDANVPQRYLIQEGDLLFSWSGSLAVRMWDRRPGWLNQHLFKVIPSEGVNNRWLRWVLTASIPEFQGMMHGSAMTHLNLDMLKQVKWPLPNPEEQCRIANFLDVKISRIDSLLEARRNQSALLSRKWTSDLSEVFESRAQEYGEVRLRHVLLKIEQGWSPQCEDRFAESGEWGVVKAGCVNSGAFDAWQHKALPSGVEPRLEYMLNVGDLLMSRASGSPDLIGSVGIVRELPRKLLLCDKVYRLTLDERYVTTGLVAYSLRHYRNREHIKMGISGAEGMANNLPISVVRDCLIPKMPVDLQRKLVGELDRKFGELTRLRGLIENSISLLTERRQALITAAVTGQFDVSTASGRNTTQGV